LAALVGGQIGQSLSEIVVFCCFQQKYNSKFVVICQYMKISTNFINTIISEDRLMVSAGIRALVLLMEIMMPIWWTWMPKQGLDRPLFSVDY
jgi:hypothetical protein